MCDRPGQERCYAIDDGKLDSELGFTSVRRLEDGQLDMCRWFVHHEPWWHPIYSSCQRWIDARHSNQA